MKKTLSFPIRLYRMLEHIEQHEDYNSIMAWQSHGRCFRIHDKKRLEQELMPLFFSTKQYESLRRSLNMWGFKQIQGLRNPDKGCYHHPMFLRTKYKLCASITRTSLDSVEDDGELPFQEPKFYTMPPLPPSSSQEQERSSASGNNFGKGGFFVRRSCDSSQSASSSESKMNISCHQFSGPIWRPNTYRATAPQVNHDNLQPSNALANEENIDIDFDTQTLQKLKTLLPDDPRDLCDVFD